MPLFQLSGASLFFNSLDTTLQVAREAGFAGVEFSPTVGTAWLRPSRVGALAEQKGMLLGSVHPATVPLPGWSVSPAAFRQLAALARSWPGCRAVVLHLPDAHHQGDRQLSSFYRTVGTIQEALAGSDLTIALENRNRHPGEGMGLLDDPAAWMECCRERGCQATLDTAHASTLPFALAEVYRTVRERLVNIHLSDVVGGAWWERFSYPRSILGHHRPPGWGNCPCKSSSPIWAKTVMTG
jgi:sugar phosphate isomerase/epimerase